ncbi:MAG: class I SAM-dependent methyltransferase [Chloroflexota bacterium]
MTENSNLWDSFWAIHASKNDIFHRLLWLIRFLFSSTYAKYIARETGELKSAKLLEIGCGSARTLHYLDRIYGTCECYALDLSPQAIYLVRSINPQFHTAIADAFLIPLNTNQLDISFSIGLIEHFTREQAGQIVNEKIRVTKPEGMVAVMVPWISSIYNLIVRKAFGKHWPFGHENPFHRKELELFLSKLGLTDIKIYVIFGTTLLGIGRKKND